MYTCLTVNATTLFARENTEVVSGLGLDTLCAVIAAPEISQIVASASLVGSRPLPFTVGAPPTTRLLTLFYLTRTITAGLGAETEVATVCTIATDGINRAFVLETLDKLMSEYLAYRYTPTSEATLLLTPTKDQLQARMTAIIAQAEARYDTDAFAATASEVDSVRTIMVENIERILERGERLSTLVNKTDRINNSSNAFRRRTVQIKRRMWWANVKLMALLGGIGTTILYVFVGAECGYPFFDHCVRH